MAVVYVHSVGSEEGGAARDSPSAGLAQICAAPAEGREEEGGGEDDCEGEDEEDAEMDMEEEMVVVEEEEEEVLPSSQGSRDAKRKR